MESYRLWCVGVFSLSLDNEEALAHLGLLNHGIIKYDEFVVRLIAFIA